MSFQRRMMIVLVCGSRDWTNPDIIRTRLSKLPQGTVVVEGEGRGADRIARDVALELGFEVLRVPANWKLYKKAAGPIRNREMLDLGPGLIIAFHEDLASSRGTIDTIVEGHSRGITYEVWDDKGERHDEEIKKALQG
jgi:hypothetical protein